MMQIDRRNALARIGSLAAVVSFGAELRGEDPNDKSDDDALVVYDDAKTYDVEHRFKLTNRDARATSLEIWIPVPIDSPAQSVSKLVVRPQSPIIRDVTGTTRVARSRLARRQMPVGQEHELTVSYRVERRRATARADALARIEPAAYPKNKATRTFLRSETRIQSDDAKIVETAKQFQDPKRSPVKIARDIYDWIAEKSEYKLLDNATSAVDFLNSRRGECTEYVALFVALCRAAGIPARPVTGFFADETDGWHAWAEFMLPEGEWIPVDPQYGDRGLLARRLAFGQTDNRRIAVAHTYDVVLRDAQRNTAECTILQSGYWRWSWRAAKQGEPKMEYPAREYSVVSKPA